MTQAAPPSPDDDASYALCMRDRAGVIRRFGHNLRGKRAAIALAPYCVPQMRPGGRLRDCESGDSIAISEVLSILAVDWRTREILAECTLPEPGSPA